MVERTTGHIGGLLEAGAYDVSSFMIPPVRTQAHSSKQMRDLRVSHRISLPMHGRDSERNQFRAITHGPVVAGISQEVENPQDAIGRAQGPRG